MPSSATAQTLGQARASSVRSAELIEEVRPNSTCCIPTGGGIVRRPASVPRLGQRVKHGKFGEGIVLSYEGAGAHARVQVNFEDSGAKWLVMSYANLEVM
jgi:DNA helicase-2/ATP-dependent DNA helicase PcrA